MCHPMVVGGLGSATSRTFLHPAILRRVRYPFPCARYALDHQPFPGAAWVCAATSEDRVDVGVIESGQSAVMTMLISKATEFDQVILFGVRDGAIPAAVKDQEYEESAKADAMLREGSLLDVAATRARDLLVVTWFGKPRPLVTV